MDLTVSDLLKDLHRDAEKVAKDLDPFSFQEFEKDFVLNHPSLKQTKSLQDSIPVTSLSFEVATYKNKFPIFKNESPIRGTILFVFYTILTNSCGNIALRRLHIIKRRIIHLHVFGET